MEIQLFISLTYSNELLIDLMVEIFRDDLEYVQSISNGAGVHIPQELISVLLHEEVRWEVLIKKRIIDIILQCILLQQVLIMILYLYCVGGQQGHCQGYITNTVHPSGSISNVFRGCHRYRPYIIISSLYIMCSYA